MDSHNFSSQTFSQLLGICQGIQLSKSTFSASTGKFNLGKDLIPLRDLWQKDVQTICNGLKLAIDRDDTLCASIYSLLFYTVIIGFRTQEDANRARNLLPKALGVYYEIYNKEYGHILNDFLNKVMKTNKRVTRTAFSRRHEYTDGTSVCNRIVSLVKDGSFGFDVWLNITDVEGQRESLGLGTEQLSMDNVLNYLPLYGLPKPKTIEETQDLGRMMKAKMAAASVETEPTREDMTPIDETEAENIPDSSQTNTRRNPPPTLSSLAKIIIESINAIKVNSNGDESVPLPNTDLSLISKALIHGLCEVIQVKKVSRGGRVIFRLGSRLQAFHVSRTKYAEQHKIAMDSVEVVNEAIKKGAKLYNGYDPKKPISIVKRKNPISTVERSENVRSDTVWIFKGTVREKRPLALRVWHLNEGTLQGWVQSGKYKPRITEIDPSSCLSPQGGKIINVQDLGI